MKQEPARSSIATLALAVLAFAGFLVAGCSPGVGSPCTLSTDCGTTGSLVCDTSEFEGYCTVEDCVAGQCPNDAACVLFDSAVPGCGYNDRRAVGSQFCMASCGSDSNCRDGYICVDPTSPPLNALVLDDDNQGVKVCVPMPLESTDGGNSTSGFNPDAAVCQYVGPAFDAATLYASFAPDARTDGDALESGAADTGAADAGD